MGKPAGHNGAVFSGHTHDIRHCPHGSQGAVSGEQLLRPVLSSQSQHQLQCNAAAGQMLEWIGTVGSMGVYHRYRPGQLILAFVVIRHHHIHAQRGGEIHFLHPGNTTVHGDDQCNALPAQGAHSVRGQAVAVLNAAGNIVTHLCAAAAQIVHKNGCGGNAVHIIIAEDGHMFSCVQRGADADHGSVHVLHQQRRQGKAVLNFQEIICGRAVGYAVGGQNGGKQGRISRLLQCIRRGSRGGQIPLFIFHARLTSLHGFWGKKNSMGIIIEVYYSKPERKGKDKSCTERENGPIPRSARLLVTVPLRPFFPCRCAPCL